MDGPHSFLSWADFARRPSVLEDKEVGAVERRLGVHVLLVELDGAGRGEDSLTDELPQVQPEDDGVEGEVAEDGVHELDGGGEKLDDDVDSVVVELPRLERGAVQADLQKGEDEPYSHESDVHLQVSLVVALIITIGEGACVRRQQKGLHVHDLAGIKHHRLGILDAEDAFGGVEELSIRLGDCRVRGEEAALDDHAGQPAQNEGSQLVGLVEGYLPQKQVVDEVGVEDRLRALSETLGSANEGSDGDEPH
mmetsp:Transcript_12955/g.21920  ORF Transcript_12955/g.21920 Transcript_12955/m.21920 type:complete len:251 (+) Transcript_12955:47-799(+)